MHGGAGSFAAIRAGGSALIVQLQLVFAAISAGWSSQRNRVCVRCVPVTAAQNQQVQPASIAD